jgi:hypothetical protein
MPNTDLCRVVRLQFRFANLLGVDDRFARHSNSAVVTRPLAGKAMAAATIRSSPQAKTPRGGLLH